MRVGLLTGGGDCPGLNAVIRAVVRRGERHYSDELVGFCDGWKGVIEGNTTPLDVERCRGLLPRGGTILGTSRTNLYKVDGGPARAIENLRAERIDALIAIGVQVVADTERVLGTDHPHTLSARANLAASYRSAGRTGEAEALEAGGHVGARPAE